MIAKTKDLPGISGLRFKRLFDVVVSSLIIVAFAPLMVFIYLAVRYFSPGGAIFRHERVGRNGASFMCLKFRTMVPNAEAVLEDVLQGDPALRAEWHEHQKLRHDPRIIPVIGPLLRSSSLDELPQLFNVLFGDMSIVGPRPVTRNELERYHRFQQHYLSVRPGLTGPWQIGGRSDSSYSSRVTKDVWYVENASLAMDVSILWSTALYFVSGRLSGGR